MDPADRPYLEAAARLQDVGYLINYDQHHKHSYHLILNSNLPGFITLNPPADNGGAQNYGSAFLSAAFQGTKFTIADSSARNRRIEIALLPALSELPPLPKSLEDAGKEAEKALPDWPLRSFVWALFSSNEFLFID